MVIRWLASELGRKISWVKLSLFLVGFGVAFITSWLITAPLMAQNPPTNVVRVGYQKYGTLSIVKAREDLEKQFKSKNVTLEWRLFPAGPQLLEALNAGAIDFGHTGESPPIFAQAAGAQLVYVANEPPNPRGEAILVHQDGSIKSVADLKGKTIALNKGSNVHFFLVEALKANKVKYEEVKLKFLPPADASAAFAQKNVDAWAIWDPFYEAGKRSLKARVLLDGEGLVANREFYLASRPFLKQYPDRVKTLLKEINKVDRWAESNHNAVATLLSPALGIDVPTLEAISRRRPYGVVPITSQVIAYQQRVADTFSQLQLIPKPIVVKDATDSITENLVSR